MDPIAFLSGLTSAVSVYKAAVEARDGQKIATATHELNVQLIQLGSEVLAMQKDSTQATERERTLLTRIHDLETNLRRLEERQAERLRYELVEPYPGVFVLRVKESALGTEPLHYLCPGCLDNKAMKSILQFAGGQKELGSCPECKAWYRFEAPKPRPRRDATAFSNYLQRG